MAEISNVNYGVTGHKGIPVVSSRRVAQVFDRRHDNVMQAIKEAIETTKKFAPDFSGTNFIHSEYKLRGRKYPEYLLTKDGFTYTVMGFTGEKAAQFKVAYINRFNEMEQQLEALRVARMEFPQLTDAIQATREDPKPYHYTNEINMINRIVLGMSAKQFREKCGIRKGESIRPHLNNEQIKAIERLQKFDIGLLHTEPDYHKRKQILTEYHQKISEIKLVTA